MEDRDKALIQQLEQDVIDEESPIQNALRKCIILGGRSGSEELRDWAKKELNGYDADDELPRYRLVDAPLKIDAIVGPNTIRGQQIHPLALPEPFRDQIEECIKLRQPLAEIHNLAKDGTGSTKMSFGASSVAADLMTEQANQPFQRITAIYWEVSRISLAAVVDQVRTVLASFVAELSLDMPSEQDIPSSQQAERALHVAINGDGAHVNIQAPTASGGSTNTIQESGQVSGVSSSEDEEPTLLRRLRLPGALLGGLIGLVSMIAGLGQWLNW